uniref:Uncharacterized protein n=1 Tax=Pararge aegeria TaxID=116150 RepID=S4PVR8_9NEOP
MPQTNCNFELVLLYTPIKLMKNLRHHIISIINWRYMWKHYKVIFVICGGKCLETTVFLVYDEISLNCIPSSIESTHQTTP